MMSAQLLTGIRCNVTEGEEDMDTHTRVTPTLYHPISSMSEYLKYLYDGLFFSTINHLIFMRLKFSVLLHT